MHREPLFATQALRAGALGYVTKSSPPEVLENAVYQVAARRQVISPDIAPEPALALIDRRGSRSPAGAAGVRNPAPLARRAGAGGDWRAPVDFGQDGAELPLPDQEQAGRAQRHPSDPAGAAPRADLGGGSGGRASAACWASEQGLQGFQCRFGDGLARVVEDLSGLARQQPHAEQHDCVLRAAAFPVGRFADNGETV